MRPNLVAAAVAASPRPELALAWVGDLASRGAGDEALAMLVKELAKTFGRFGIRVNALVPGAIAAGGFVADPSLARYIPLGRLGRSEDLAPMALAVLSNGVSAYVTGIAIVVDGGPSLTNWFDPPTLDDL